MSLSITPDEQIYMDVRMGYNVIGYSSDGYFGLHCKAGVSDPYCGSMITIHRSFPQGQYSWIGRIREIASDAVYYFGFEFTHGNPVYGIATFLITNGVLRCQTVSHSGEQKFSDIGVFDLSNDTLFSIDWDSNQVVFGLNGVRVATHYEGIPVKDMPFFFEVCRGSSVSRTSFIEVKAGSFEDNYTPAPFIPFHEHATYLSEVPAEFITESELQTELDKLIPPKPPDDYTLLYLAIGIIAVMIIAGVIMIK